MSPAEALVAIGKRFASGNEVPVDRAVVPAAEWAALTAAPSEQAAITDKALEQLMKMAHAYAAAYFGFTRTGDAARFDTASRELEAMLRTELSFHRIGGLIEGLHLPEPSVLEASATLTRRGLQ